MNRPVLSICIPTYNRADKLYYCLNNILASASLFPQKVEVIVSDNASEDSTSEVIAKFKEKYPMLRAFRNPDNMGFNRNFFKLSDIYATGKYLWVIGDDDFLDFDAINIVLKVIEQNSKVSYIGLNFRLLQLDEITSYKKEPIITSVEVTTVEQAIDLQARPENMLATFLSCNIIERDKLANFDKSIFSTDTWENYQSIFPHTYMIAKTISPNECGVYISNPLMSVCIHQKSWDDKLIELRLHSIVNIYKHFIECGYSKLKNSHEVIIQGGKSLLFNRKVAKELRLHFWRFVRFSPTFYFNLTSAIYRKLLR